MQCINLDTQDAKIAEFVEEATDHFVQMEHTRRLSEWRMCKSCCDCVQHPFRFFLASNGQNLIRLNRLKLFFNFLVCVALIMSVGEPVDDQLEWRRAPRNLLTSVEETTLTYIS